MEGLGGSRTDGKQETEDQKIKEGKMTCGGGTEGGRAVTLVKCRYQTSLVLHPRRCPTLNGFHWVVNE